MNWWFLSWPFFLGSFLDLNVVVLPVFRLAVVVVVVVVVVVCFLPNLWRKRRCIPNRGEAVWERTVTRLSSTPGLFMVLSTWGLPSLFKTRENTHSYVAVAVAGVVCVYSLCLCLCVIITHARSLGKTHTQTHDPTYGARRSRISSHSNSIRINKRDDRGEKGMGREREIEEQVCVWPSWWWFHSSPLRNPTSLYLSRQTHTHARAVAPLQVFVCKSYEREFTRDSEERQQQQQTDAGLPSLPCVVLMARANTNTKTLASRFCVVWPLVVWLHAKRAEMKKKKGTVKSFYH